MRGVDSTSWCGGFGVREQHDATLALLYKLRERCLLSIVRFNLSTEVGEVDCVANLWCTCGGNSGSR